jgi:hypothetical protein
MSIHTIVIYRSGAVHNGDYREGRQRMDLPCSCCSLWLHAGGTEPREHLRPLALSRPAIPPSPLSDRVGYSDHVRFRGYIPVHFILAYRPGTPPVHSVDGLLTANAQIDPRAFGQAQCQLLHSRRKVLKRVDLLDDRDAFLLFFGSLGFPPRSFAGSHGRSLRLFASAKAPPRLCDPPCSKKQAGIGPISRKPELVTSGQTINGGAWNAQDRATSCE